MTIPNYCVFATLPLICITLRPIGASAQELMHHHTLIKDLGLLSKPGISNINLRISHNLQYSVTGSLSTFLNWKKTGEVSHLFLLQDLKYSSLFDDNGSVRISNTFTHNLGLQIYLDSISRFQRDENMITTRIDIVLKGGCAYNFTSVLSSRLFNDYTTVVNDSGVRRRTLTSGFLTPLLWTVTSGFNFIIRQTGKLLFGISAAKMTFILNRQIYQLQGIDSFFGVPESKGYIFEYGLALQLLIDRDLFKIVHWDCDLQLFKNYQKPLDMNLKSIFTLRINKFLRASLQTRVFYDESVSKKLQIENFVALGFYVHL